MSGARKGKKITKQQSAVDRYTPYLHEVRRKIFQVLVVFAVGGIFGFLYYRPILIRILSLFQLNGINVVLTSPYQFIDLSIYTGLVTGCILAFPLFLYHLLQFIRPALKPEEYRTVLQTLPFSIGLFLGGFGFGVWVMQFVISLYSQTSSDFALSNIWDIGHFFSQILVTGLSLAVAFQMPIVLNIAMRLGFLHHAQISQQRRYIYVSAIIFAAVLPPTDLISMSLLAIVPLFLFEITLLLNHPRRMSLQEVREGAYVR